MEERGLGLLLGRWGLVEGRSLVKFLGFGEGESVIVLGGSKV